MGFLKKLGTILLKSTELITGFGPLIPPQYAHAEQILVSDLKAIQQVVVNVEAFGQVLGIPGPDKLRAAGPLVAQMILQSSIIAGHKIENAALFQQGSTKVADGMADILNALKDDIQTEAKT